MKPAYTQHAAIPVDVPKLPVTHKRLAFSVTHTTNIGKKNVA